MKKVVLITLGMSGMLLATSPNIYVDMSTVMLTHSDNGTTSDFKPKESNALSQMWAWAISADRSPLKEKLLEFLK